MRSEIARPLAVMAAVSWCAVSAFAQSGEGAIKGALQSDEPRIFSGYTAALANNQRHDVASADIRSDGSFEFGNVASGAYELIVSDGRGQVLYRKFVSVPSHGGEFDVRLPEENVERPPSGAVSASQLLHPPDRKAVEWVFAAQKLSDAGEYTKAAAQLEKAVAISPEFANAHINLGAMYLRLGRYQEAVDETERALQIGPPAALPLSNLAFGQYMLSRNADAIESARRCLRLDPSHAPAHYVLGMALAATGQPLSEAIAHLEKAAESMPSVRAGLDRLRAQWAAK